MANRYHDLEVEGSIHIPNDLTYANQTARLAAAGLVARHVGRLAKQTDDNSYWVLTSISPVTWAAFTPPKPSAGDVTKVLTVESDGAGGERLTWAAGGVGVHDLGGSDHNADTLANLNLKVSDATLDDSGDSRTPTAHDLAGAEHNADTLANLNLKVSDATLDDSSATRTPVAHDLAGAEHNADTLANLNLKVSDATLDDSGDPRDPNAHALAGAEHNADTLANLNLKVSDATLDDSGDPRTPAAHDWAGAEHNADTLANLNLKVSDATLDDSGDSRTPTSHAASHEGGADPVDVVSLTSATGTSSDVLTKSAGTALVWSAPGAPGAHTLGGASHTADTLANLNTKVSDATLDDSSDPRDPNAHDLAGAEHNADTLANLNLKVSDATLDDSGDSRTPTSHASSHEGGADAVDVVSLHSDTGIAGQLLMKSTGVDTAWVNNWAAQHDLGGTQHNADTLANLNTKVSDATLDDSGDPRDPNAHAASHEGGSDSVDVVSLTSATGTSSDVLTKSTGSALVWSAPGAPGAHTLGGASHTADTLANLNTKVSDATLDDSGDPRDPNAHDLGGAAHGADTLANLNTKVSDATLDDSGDPRDPNAHDLAGADHNADTLANLNTKVSDATLDDSGDPRDPNAHAASHEGGADPVDVVSLTSATGTSSDVLTKSTGSALVWSAPGAPGAHALGGASHTADTLANLNTKVSDATLDDSGDPRDPNVHDHTDAASGGLIDSADLYTAEASQTNKVLTPYTGNDVRWQNAQFQTGLNETWTYDNTITDGDPGSGNFRANHLIFALATFLYFDTNAKSNFNMAQMLLRLRVGDYITVQQDNSWGNYSSFELTGTSTDGTGYIKVPVTIINYNGDIVDGSQCGFRFFNTRETLTHDLAGASHNADTLANLNTKISDATLDDSGDSRTPTAHALDGVEHTGTLPEADVAFDNATGHTHDGTDATAVDHTDLTSKGTNTHAQVDTHIADSDIHFDFLDFASDIQRFTGFANGSTDTTLSWVEGTRTFTVTPTGASFDVYIHGVKHTISGAEDVIWPDVSGLYFVYYDGATLTTVLVTAMAKNPIKDVALVAVFFWNTTIDKLIGVADERHGANMSEDTHLYLHNTVGTKYDEGLALTVDSTDAAADEPQVISASGIVWDEDIQFAIPAFGTDASADPAELQILFKVGAAGSYVWNAKTADDFLVIQQGATDLASNVILTGGTYPAFNELTGGSWQLTEISGLSRYWLMHVFAVGGYNGATFGQLVCICGEGEYTTVGQARDAAPTEIANIQTDGLPANEMLACYTLIMQSTTNAGNTVKAYVRTTDDGDDYIDFRTTSTASVGTGNDHGGLSGLGDDDHTQYSLADGTRAFTGAVEGVTPTIDAHLSTKLYIDDHPDMAANTTARHVRQHGLGTAADHTSATLAQLNVLVSDATLDDSGDSRTPTAHTLGGALHIADTLADLNTKVSDATLDDSGDSRTPTTHASSHEGGADSVDVVSLTSATGTSSDVLTKSAGTALVWSAPGAPGAHTLGGASHTADTLANLNTKVSDATLDDSGDPRDPNAHNTSHEGGSDPVDVASLTSASGTSGQVLTKGTGSTAAWAAPSTAVHALGGAGHSADTLANLNSKVSDATLDDSSATRTAAAHTLGSAQHSSDTLANLSAKVSDATSLVGTTNTQTLTNKTLTTPTIASLTNATHDHSDAPGGGTLTKTTVGLANVTNDAQLKRAANDISTFTAKGTPVDADLILIEDSAAAGVKKKITIGDLPSGGGGGPTAPITISANSTTDNSGPDSHGHQVFLLAGSWISAGSTAFTLGANWETNDGQIITLKRCTSYSGAVTTVTVNSTFGDYSGGSTYSFGWSIWESYQMVWDSTSSKWWIISLA